MSSSEDGSGPAANDSKDLKPITVVAISDTHGIHKNPNFKVPEGDILIFSGDAGLDDVQDVAQLEKWLGTLPHRHKVYVPGNMDPAMALPSTPPAPAHEEKGQEGGRLPQQRKRMQCRRLEGVHVLGGDSVELEGYRIVGSPYTPKYYGAFQFENDQQAAEHWGSVLPSQPAADQPAAPPVHILVTHGPPYGTADVTRRRHAGDKQLLAAVQELPQPPLLWVCGHIHESHGHGHLVRHEKTGKDIKLVNAAVAYLIRGETDAGPVIVKLPQMQITRPKLDIRDKQSHRKPLWQAPLSAFYG